MFSVFTWSGLLFVIGFVPKIVLSLVEDGTTAVGSDLVTENNVVTHAFTSVAAIEMKETFVSGALLILFCSVVLSLFITHWARHFRILWIQAPFVSTCIGFIVGLLLWFVIPKGPVMLDGILSFNDQVFFIALLPPIIFHSGFSLVGPEGEQFLSNFGAILWFAVFGTFISFITTGSLMFVSSVLRLGTPFSWRESFAFGAALSSTDPVVAVTVFKDIGAPPLLVSILSGESLMNDALSILLYKSMTKSTRQLNAPFLWMWDFVWMLFASMTLGVIVGLISALVYKYMNLHQDANRLLESALFLVFPWICYLVSDGVGMSAIVSILFAGMTMARYTYPNLSNVGKETSKNIFGALALLTEATIFVLLGLAVFSAEHPTVFDWRLYATTAVTVSASRFLSVYTTSYIVNWCRPAHRQLPPIYQWILSVCGARGAVAFALALGSRHDFGREVGSQMLSATLFYAILIIGAISVFLPRITSRLHSATTPNLRPCDAPPSLSGNTYAPLEYNAWLRQPNQLSCSSSPARDFSFTATSHRDVGFDGPCDADGANAITHPSDSAYTARSLRSSPLVLYDALSPSYSEGCNPTRPIPSTNRLILSVTDSLKELLLRLDRVVMQPTFINPSSNQDPQCSLCFRYHDVQECRSSENAIEIPSSRLYSSPSV